MKLVRKGATSKYHCIFPSKYYRETDTSVKATKRPLLKVFVLFLPPQGIKATSELRWSWAGWTAMAPICTPSILTAQLTSCPTSPWVGVHTHTITVSLVDGLDFEVFSCKQVSIKGGSQESKSSQNGYLGS